MVIQGVKYTEIDWIAYMQEVEGVLNGTYDYRWEHHYPPMSTLNCFRTVMKLNVVGAVLTSTGVPCIYNSASLDMDILNFLKR